MDDLPVEREVPEPEPEPELPVLTWELFDQWAGRYVALQEERVQLVVEITSLKGRVEDLTRAVEELRDRANERVVAEFSSEFNRVYEDIKSR